MPVRRTPTAALIQLPVPQACPDDARGNVPLAAGYLAAYARQAGLETHLAPPPVQNHGGDTAVLAWLEDLRPVVLGFTTYLWNIERSRSIARAWKERHPETTVVMGGAEITEDSAGMAHGIPDTAVVGEGEAAWADILRRCASGETSPARIGPGWVADPGALPDPYLAGVLRPEPGGSVFLETVRGCNRWCDYCYYSKATTGLRAFPAERISSVVALAAECRVADLYVMDPCFNAAPDYLDKLRILAKANTTRIPLHTEVELESVTPEAADLYARAGFASVEAGLQSTNRAALTAVHRGWRRAEFLRGARLLRERGVTVRIGIILGLPRDTLDGFLETIRFVRDEGLGDGVEVYPLAVLPGTRLRRRAAELGVEYMASPPYWVLSNGSMGGVELVEALELAQAGLDLDFYPPILPHFHDPAPGLVGYRDLRVAGETERLRRVLERGEAHAAISLTLRVQGPTPADPAGLRAVGALVRRRCPHTMTQIVVDCDPPPPWQPWAEIATAFHTPGHYLDRVHCYAPDPQDRFSVRLLHLTADPGVALSYYDTDVSPDRRFDPVLRWSRALVAHPRLLERLPALVLDTGAAPLPPEVARAYREHATLLVRGP